MEMRAPLNNQCIKEETTREITEYLEMNENEDIHT